MVTRRARHRGSVARVALLGALALALLFGALQIDSITAAANGSESRHSVIIPRDTKSSVAAASSSRARGSAWVASLVSAVGCAGVAAQLIRAGRRGRAARKLQQFSIRLRAPPNLRVAL